MLSAGRVLIGANDPAHPTVDYRVRSKPGNPKRDFYVTDKAVVLSTTWKSGIHWGYMYWWIAAISVEKRDESGITPTIDCSDSGGPHLTHERHHGVASIA
jgi:hypothetical protein